MFNCPSQEIWLADLWKFIFIDQLRFYKFLQSWVDSELFNMTSKYFCTFSNTSPARDFLYFTPARIIISCYVDKFKSKVKPADFQENLVMNLYLKLIRNQFILRFSSGFWLERNSVTFVISPSKATGNVRKAF